MGACVRGGVNEVGGDWGAWGLCTELERENLRILRNGGMILRRQEKKKRGPSVREIRK